MVVRDKILCIIAIAMVLLNLIFEFVKVPADIKMVTQWATAIYMLVCLICFGLRKNK